MKISSLFTIILLTFVLSFLPNVIWAQHEADNWFFGNGIGLSFAMGRPTPIYGSPIHQIEGTAVISDPVTGNLLFYTDGVKAWNRMQQLLENGDGLMGSGTSTQSALITQFPEKPGLYFLFTTRSYADNKGGLHYSLVDMTLAGGFGSIREEDKNTLLERYGSEKLTAIPHVNQRDFWLITHRWDSDIFLVYLVSPSGIGNAKEIKIGTYHQASIENNQIGEEMGALKASPDGHLLAAAIYGVNRPFELYDFDNRTGIISNYRNLGNFSGQYGVSFSPDNSKLYMSGLSDEGCYQFDLNDLKSDPFLISVGDTSKISSAVGGSMELGPDGKLYVASIDRQGLIVINTPNKKGEEIDLQELTFDLKGGKVLEGLPNFIQSTFNTSQVDTNIPEDLDCNDNLLVYPNPVLGEKFTVQMDSTDWDKSCELLNLKVYFMSGIQFLLNVNYLNDTFEVDVKNWPAGLYLLVFEYKNKRVVKKIVRL